MPAQRSLTGRGIAALIPTTPPPAATTRQGKPGIRASASATTSRPPASTADTGARSIDPVPQGIPGLVLLTIGLDEVRPNPKQPRQEFDPDSITELARSIEQVGLLQPIVVRASKGDVGAGPSYELVAGERRWRAARAAGMTEIPAVVRSTEDDAMLRDALLENLQRVQLNPLEEAAAYQQLLVDFGGTHDELAEKLGKSRPQVSNTLRLLKLPAAVQRRVAAGVLSAGHARALLGVTDPAQVEQLAKRVVAEGLSVRALEEIVTVADGSSSTPKRKQPTRGRVPLPELEAVADRLADRFETRVQVTMGRSKGKVVIDFAGIEDLSRLVDLLFRD